jgi:hypothetical protein
MLLSLMVLALAASPPPTTAQVPVTVCNAIGDELDEVTFATSSWEGVVVVHQVKPHACAQVQGLAPGDYMLSFIDPMSAVPMCRGEVTVKAGAQIAISPKSGFRCQT